VAQPINQKRSAQSSTPFDRVPPHNLEAEQSVLGAMLLSSDAIPLVTEILESDHFYRDIHRQVYDAIVGLYSHGEAVDPITVAEQLKNSDALERAGGKAYIHTLVNVVPTAANARYYAEIVEKDAALRGLIRASTEIVGLGYEAPEDVEAVIDRAETLIFSVAQKRVSEKFVPIKELLAKSFEDLSRMYDTGGHVAGIGTGYPDLDRILTGLHKGDLIILAARPTMGKTALALNIAQNVAAEKVPVAIFSLEMAGEQLVQRMICSEARIDSQKLRTGHLGGDDWNKLSRAMGRLDSPIFIDDTPSIGIMEVRAKARRLFAHHDVGLIIVDYLQLMQPGRRTDNRQQEIAEISRGLKILAKELGIPVIAISQLSRAIEQRGDKKPMLSDLRECVTGDTLVTLTDGRRVPIEDLVGKSAGVWAVSEEGRICPAWSDRIWPVGSRPVRRITLASGRSIEATNEHRLLGAKGWVHVGDLTVGDRLAIAREIPAPAEPIEWPDERVALLGQLIGDGSYVSHQPLRFTTASEDNSRLVADAARSQFGAKVSRYEGRGAWHQLLISGNGNRWHPAGVNRWLRELGIYNQRSAEKRVPPDCFRLSNRQVALLLKHLWATDGSVWLRPAGDNGSPRVYFSTCSPGLARDVAALLLRLGIVARVRGVGGSQRCHTVDIHGAESLRRFVDVVGGFGPREAPVARLTALLNSARPTTNVDTLPQEVFGAVKAAMSEQWISQRAMTTMRGTSYGGTSHFRFSPSRGLIAEYAELLNDGTLQAWASSDLFWDRVVSTEDAGIKHVYDLTVPGPSCWLADGIVSHNSGAIEQDADVVIFLHRDIYASEEDIEDKLIADVIIAKHRNGPTGKIQLRFFDTFTKFVPLAKG